VFFGIYACLGFLSVWVVGLAIGQVLGFRKRAMDMGYSVLGQGIHFFSISFPFFLWVTCNDSRSDSTVLVSTFMRGTTCCLIWGGIAIAYKSNLMHIHYNLTL